MSRLALLLILVGFTANAFAQPEPPLVNGPLEPVKQFTLLLITGDQPTQNEQYLAGILERPQEPDLIRIRQIAYAKTIPASAATVQQKHQDIMQSIRLRSLSLPVLSLVDAEGGVWGMWGARSLPTNEYGLSRLLQIQMAAVLQSKRKAEAEGRVAPTPPVNSINFMQPGEAQQILGGGRPGGGLFNPQISPQINVPDGGFDANLNTRAIVDPDTRNWILMVVLAVCATAIVCVVLYGRAVTDRPEDVDEFE